MPSFAPRESWKAERERQKGLNKRSDPGRTFLTALGEAVVSTAGSLGKGLMDEHIFGGKEKREADIGLTQAKTSRERSMGEAMLTEANTPPMVARIQTEGQAKIQELTNAGKYQEAQAERDRLDAVMSEVGKYSSSVRPGQKIQLPGGAGVSYDRPPAARGTGGPKAAPAAQRQQLGFLLQENEKRQQELATASQQAMLSGDQEGLARLETERRFMQRERDNLIGAASMASGLPFPQGAGSGLADKQSTGTKLVDEVIGRSRPEKPPDKKDPTPPSGMNDNVFRSAAMEYIDEQGDDELSANGHILLKAARTHFQTGEPFEELFPSNVKMREAARKVYLAGMKEFQDVERYTRETKNLPGSRGSTGVTTPER